MTVVFHDSGGVFQLFVYFISVKETKSEYVSMAKDDHIMCFAFFASNSAIAKQDMLCNVDLYKLCSIGLSCQKSENNVERRNVLCCTSLTTKKCPEGHLEAPGKS